MKLPFERFLSYGMNRANLALMPSLFDGFASLGLHAREAAILWLVEANPGCSQIDIARALGVQRTNLAPIVGKLVKDGLINRSQSNGRTHSLTVSSYGMEKVSLISALAIAHDQRFFGELSQAERLLLTNLFQSLPYI